MSGPIKVDENQPIDAGDPTEADIQRAKANYAAMSPETKSYLRSIDDRVRGIGVIQRAKESTTRLREDYNPDEERDDQGRWSGGGGGSSAPITADEARGDSKAVSADEFQRLAADGHSQLDAMRANSSSTTGLDRNYEAIRANAFDEAQKPWGGVTIDAHTGTPLTVDNGGKYALTVSGLHGGGISVPENASRETFNAAMDQARSQFDAALQSENHYLGVFHDDDLKRIDFDAVVNAPTVDSVYAIGAASHAIGGAYDFSTGDGVWVPHVGG